MNTKNTFTSALLLVFLIPVVSFSFSLHKEALVEWGILEDILFTKGQEFLEVQLVVDQFTRFRAFEMTDPDRIVIDLYGVWDIEAPQFVEVNACHITRIRHGMFQSEIARIVFEVDKEFPRYRIEKEGSGLKISFQVDLIPQEKEVPPAEVAQEKELKSQAQLQIQQAEMKAEKIEKISKAGEKKVTKQEEAQESVNVVGEIEKQDVQEVPEKTGADETEAELPEEERPEDQSEVNIDTLSKQLEDTLSILAQLNEERLLRQKKFIRILATGNLFSPREGNLKNIYDEGMMYGAELNFGISDFVEIWLAEHYYSKMIVDVNSEEERSVSLIPIELGLKFRMNKGVFNPYVGIGGGYFQYREETPEGEIRERNIGFIGQAGLFVKIGGFFVVDIFAHFKHCPMTTESDKFDVGGFHFGGAVGFEF